MSDPHDTRLRPPRRLDFSGAEDGFLNFSVMAATDPRCGENERLLVIAIVGEDDRVIGYRAVPSSDVAAVRDSIIAALDAAVAVLECAADT